MRPLDKEQLARLCNSNPFEPDPVRRSALSGWGVIALYIGGVAVFIALALTIGALVLPEMP